jgi:hypothetical protein
VVCLALLLALALIVFANRGHVHFDWAVFRLELRHVDWRHIAAGVGLIYTAIWLRALRWSVLIRRTKRVSARTLIGPQFIGFTAVALFGRLADAIRPALVARRVGMSVSSQVAVYTIERTFDLGSAAMIFSGALLLAPSDLPHHEVFVRAGMMSLGVTALLAIFALVTRAAGGAVADVVGTALGWLSKPIAERVAGRIRGYRDGLVAIRSALDFVIVALLSLAMWGLIASAYVQTLHAFVDTPELATISFSHTMLLMGASLGGSALQLPIIGWFTQIAVTATAMHTFYDAPIEAATACGALLLIVTFISIIPTGLVFARIHHFSMKASLKKAAEEGGVDATQ